MVRRPQTEDTFLTLSSLLLVLLDTSEILVPPVRGYRPQGGQERRRLVEVRGPGEDTTPRLGGDDPRVTTGDVAHPRRPSSLVPPNSPTPTRGEGETRRRNIETVLIPQTRQVPVFFPRTFGLPFIDGTDLTNGTRDVNNIL